MEHNYIKHACSWQAVREFAAGLSKQLGLDIYTFSVWHVFFEQYLGIGGASVRLLGARFAEHHEAWLIGFSFDASPIQQHWP